MKTLIPFILMILSLSAFAQTQRLVGKWATDPKVTDGDVYAYEFKSDNTLKMFLNDQEAPTETPIKYKIVENDDKFDIEIEFIAPMSNSPQTLQGLIKFLDDTQLKMELFPFDEQAGKKNEFTKDAIIFTKV